MVAGGLLSLADRLLVSLVACFARACIFCVRLSYDSLLHLLLFSGLFGYACCRMVRSLLVVVVDDRYCSSFPPLVQLSLLHDNRCSCLFVIDAGCCRDFFCFRWHRFSSQWHFLQLWIAEAMRCQELGPRRTRSQEKLGAGRSQEP